MNNAEHEPPILDRYYESRTSVNVVLEALLFMGAFIAGFSLLSGLVLDLIAPGYLPVTGRQKLLLLIVAALLLGAGAARPFHRRTGNTLLALAALLSCFGQFLV